MINEHLTALATYIFNANSAFFDAAYELARKDEKGQVVVRDEKAGRYVGISDQKGNFFYLRFMGDPDVSYSTAKNIGVKNIKITLSLRMVVVASGYDVFAAERKLRNDILSFGNTELRSSHIDSAKVFEMETGSTDKYSYKKQLMAMDFALSYNEAVNDCLDELSRETL
jgi:hypothetical protein